MGLNLNEILKKNDTKILLLDNMLFSFFLFSQNFMVFLILTVLIMDNKINETNELTVALLILLPSIIISLSFFVINLYLNKLKNNKVFFVKENEYKILSKNDICCLKSNKRNNRYILKINKHDTSYVAIRKNEIYHRGGYDYKIIMNPLGGKLLVVMKDNTIISSVDVEKVVYNL